MTTRDQAIEAMARAVCRSRLTAVRYSPANMPAAINQRWHMYAGDTAASLDALLSALPALGLRVVPAEATAKMRSCGRQNWAMDNRVEKARLDWIEMCRAAPNPLASP
jgi:hypothetical protein